MLGTRKTGRDGEEPGGVEVRRCTQVVFTVAPNQTLGDCFAYDGAAMARSDYTQRAKATLFWAILVCLASQVGLAVYVDTRCADLSDPEFGVRLNVLRRALAASPGRPLLVAIGSSRTSDGFATDPLQARLSNPAAPITFNMGIKGTGPFKELLCLRRLLQAGIRPQSVLIEVLPGLLHVDSEAIHRVDYLPVETVHRKDLELCRRYIPDRAWSYEREWFLGQCLPAYSRRLLLLQRFAFDWLPPEVSAAVTDTRAMLTPLGWRPNRWQGEPNYPMGVAMARRAYAPLLKYDAIPPTTDRIMREMLELCRREHIHVAGLVAMPEGHSFRALYAAVTERVVRDYLNSLAADYDTRFIDARDWVDDRYFFDGHHLLSQGAEIFTARLWKEIGPPSVREAPAVDAVIARR